MYTKLPVCLLRDTISCPLGNQPTELPCMPPVEGYGMPSQCHNTKRLTVDNRGCRVWIVPRSFYVKYHFCRCRKYYFEHVSFLFLLLCIHVYVLYLLSINTILPLKEYKIIIITSPFIVKSTKGNYRDISLLGFTVLTGLV